MKFETIETERLLIQKLDSKTMNTISKQMMKMKLNEF